MSTFMATSRISCSSPTGPPRRINEEFPLFGPDDYRSLKADGEGKASHGVLGGNFDVARNFITGICPLSISRGFPYVASLFSDMEIIMTPLQNDTSGTEFLFDV